MPVRAADGRRVGACRNGYGYVSVLDDRRNCFVLDNTKAEKLAAGLANVEPCRVSTNHAQVLALHVVKAERDVDAVVPELEAVKVILGDANTEAPAGRPQQPTFRSGWELNTAQCRQLAEEIRELLPRAA
jgi:hypothetical protein